MKRLGGNVTGFNSSATRSYPWPRVSVVIVLEHSLRGVEQCINALCSNPDGVEEVILVVDRAVPSFSGEASQFVRVVYCHARGIAERRNAGAAVATGDVIGFVASDARADRDWAAAISQSFRDGAALAAGPIFQGGWLRHPRRQHDLAGRDEFLPSATGDNLVVRRELFHALGGFDPAVDGCDDHDLCFRAQLAGHDLQGVTGAAVHLTGESPGARGRRALRVGRGHTALRQKYNKFVFHGALPDRHRVSLRGVGSALGWLELLSGHRSPPIVLNPPGSREQLLVRPLPPGPRLALIGPRAHRLRLLAAAGPTGSQLAVPPPGLLEEVLPRWEEPAPWALHAARLAARAGWNLPVELTARRIELERPATWGEACLALHGIFAWISRKDGFGVALCSPADSALNQRFPGLPVVATRGVNFQRA